MFVAADFFVCLFVCLFLFVFVVVVFLLLLFCFCFLLLLLFCVFFFFWGGGVVWFCVECLWDVLGSKGQQLRPRPSTQLAADYRAAAGGESDPDGYHPASSEVRACRGDFRHVLRTVNTYVFTLFSARCAMRAMERN